MVKPDLNPWSGDFFCGGCEIPILHNNWLSGQGVTAVGTPVAKSLHLNEDFQRGVLQHLNRDDAENPKNAVRVSFWLMRYGRCEPHLHAQCHQTAMLVVRPPEWWQLRDKIMPLALQSNDPNVPCRSVIPKYWKLLVDAMPFNHSLAYNLKQRKEDHLCKECKFSSQHNFQLACVEEFPGGLLVGESLYLKFTSLGGVFQHVRWGISVNWEKVPANTRLSKSGWSCHMTHCHCKLWMVIQPPEWWQLWEKIMPPVPRKSHPKKAFKLVTRPPEWWQLRVIIMPLSKKRHHKNAPLALRNSQRFRAFVGMRKFGVMLNLPCMYACWTPLCMKHNADVNHNLMQVQKINQFFLQYTKD